MWLVPFTSSSLPFLNSEIRGAATVVAYNVVNTVVKLIFRLFFVDLNLVVRRYRRCHRRENLRCES